MATSSMNTVEPFTSLLKQKNMALSNAIDDLDAVEFKAVVKQLCLLDPALEAALVKELLVDEDQVRRERLIGSEDDSESESDGADEDDDESEDDGESDVEDVSDEETRPSLESLPSRKRRREEDSHCHMSSKKARQSALVSAPPKLGRPADLGNTNAKALKARYARCTQCHKSFDVTANNAEACAFHPGELEPDDDFFADHDENCHGPIYGTEDQYPQGFFWDCCDEDNTTAGCERDWHQLPH